MLCVAAVVIRAWQALQGLGSAAAPGRSGPKESPHAVYDVTAQLQAPVVLPISIPIIVKIDRQNHGRSETGKRGIVAPGFGFPCAKVFRLFAGDLCIGMYVWSFR